MPSDRTTFLIDGFNLYHSVIEASNDLHAASTRWLNIRALDFTLNWLGSKRNGFGVMAADRPGYGTRKKKQM